MNAWVRHLKLYYEFVIFASMRAQSGGKVLWEAWEDKTFRIKLISVGLFVVTALICLTFFFPVIERRHGVFIQDTLLTALKPMDVSLPVFFIIWTSALLMILTMIRNPVQMMLFLFSYGLITFLRMATIYSFPLEAPAGLIALKDPLSNLFYGSTFVTKDLFFSGHASTLFLIGLCQDKKWSRLYCLTGVCVLSVLLLVQHVHYTIDVIFAFPFTYICYLMGKKFVRL